MKDSFGSNFAVPATNGPAITGGAQGEARRLPRAILLTGMTLAALLVCCTQAAFVWANTSRASGVGYLSLALVMLGCALAFGAGARTAKGVLHIRWSLMAAASLAASMGFVPSFLELILNGSPLRVFQISCFNASEALYMLAAVLFFAGVGRAIVLVDMLQALLFILLRFNLIYSPVSEDHFTINHLMVSQLLALFLFLVALVACFGAASRAEVRFLRTLSWFFGLRLIAYFLSDQVSYTWLHHIHCSLWDVPGSVLLAGFSLYTLYTVPSKGSAAADTELRAPSVMVRSLMPSVLALVNLILGLFLLPVSVTLAAVAMSFSLVCYVARTVLLQAEAMKEKTLLETRNEHLEGLAIRDPLTGIGNRRSLADVYSRLQSGTGGPGLSLLLIDVDQFKQANDCHGHQYGDQVLMALARKLERIEAGVADAHCVRMGGDEFALLLPHVTAEVAAALAEELRAAFRAHKFDPGGSAVSLSIGIATQHAGRNLPLETLVCCADEALYRAKQLGRNRVEVEPAREFATAAGSATPGPRLELQQIAS